MIFKVILTLLATASLANAELVVISDIDDTIKISHVLDKSETTKNSVRIGNVFRGMPELYHTIAAAHIDTKFYYLSNAPEKIMLKNHQDFLKLNRFPEGTLLVRKSLRDKNHKVNAIRSILQDSKVTGVIFIGDNGERDTLIYSQMAKEFSSLSSVTFIRQAYSIQNSEDRGKPLEADQKGFVSPLDISTELVKQNVLTERESVHFETYFVAAALKATSSTKSKTGALTFPSWMDCRDYQMPLSLSQNSNLETRIFLQFVEQRCSRTAIED